MKMFIDSANINEIRTANEWGVIDGVTTNPSLVAKEKKDFKENIQDIIRIVDGHISVEAISIDTEGMVKEAEEMSGWSSNIVVKIPMVPEGLRAVKTLNFRNINIKTNVTLVFSVNQAILAAKSGADYVSPFVGRLDDIGHDGMQTVRDMVYIFKLHGFETKVIVASVRHPLHVIEAAKAGAYAVTVPFSVIEKMFYHPLTDIGLEIFSKDWERRKT